jgi:hypothetical protein
MLSKLKIYLPWVLAVGLFFAGRFTGSQPDKELINKYEAERKLSESAMKDLNAQLVDLAEAGRHEREKRQADSLKTIVVLKAKDEAYFKLKREYEKINLSRASVVELDSIGSVIESLYIGRAQ